MKRDFFFLIGRLGVPRDVFCGIEEDEMRAGTWGENARTLPVSK